MKKEQCTLTSATGKVGKLVFARLPRGCDFMGGLERICEDHGIQGGCLVTCIGAFREMVLHNPPPGGQKGSFAPPVRLLGPIQLLSCQGIIGRSEEGNTCIHLHATVFCSNENGIYGGHLRKGENEVSVTLELVIAVAEDVNLAFRMESAIDPVEPTFRPGEA